MEIPVGIKGNALHTQPERGRAQQVSTCAEYLSRFSNYSRMDKFVLIQDDPRLCTL